MVGEDFTDAGHYAAGEIEGEVAEVSHFVVDAVAEDVEEQHVEEHVQRQAVAGVVKESVGEEGGEGWMAGVEGVVVCEWLVDALDDEDDDVGGDEQPIHVGRAAERAVSAEGEEHGLGEW